MSKTTRQTAILAAAAMLAVAGPAVAAEVNVYSARHYDTDAALYESFTEATGITVNVIEAGADELIERIRAEGANSPADVLLTVDAGRLWRAEEAGAGRASRRELPLAMEPVDEAHAPVSAARPRPMTEPTTRLRMMRVSDGCLCIQFGVHTSRSARGSLWTPIE